MSGAATAFVFFLLSCIFFSCFGLYRLARRKVDRSGGSWWLSCFNDQFVRNQLALLLVFMTMLVLLTGFQQDELRKVVLSTVPSMPWIWTIGLLATGIMSSAFLAGFSLWLGESIRRRTEMPEQFEQCVPPKCDRSGW